MTDPDTYSVFETLPRYLQERISEAENFDDTGLHLPVSEKNKSVSAQNAAAAAYAAERGSAYSVNETADDDYGDLPF